MLATIIRFTPTLANRFPPKYSRIPRVKKKMRIPPINMAPLNSRDTSPTPNSLKALFSHLNHGERTVAAKTNAMGNSEPKIPQNPPKRKSFTSFEAIPAINEPPKRLIKQ